MVGLAGRLTGIAHVDLLMEGVGAVPPALSRRYTYRSLSIFGFVSGAESGSLERDRTF